MVHASSTAQPIELSRRPALARNQLRTALAREGWPETRIDAVALAVHEALVNAERHAGGAERAEMALQGSSLVVEVEDRGPGFDPQAHVGTPPDPMAERGRGLWMISNVADEWEVRHQGDGKCVQLRFRR